MTTKIPENDPDDSAKLTENEFVNFDQAMLDRIKRNMITIPLSDLTPDD